MWYGMAMFIAGTVVGFFVAAMLAAAAREAPRPAPCMEVIPHLMTAGGSLCGRPAGHDGPHRSNSGVEANVLPFDRREHP